MGPSIPTLAGDVKPDVCAVKVGENVETVGALGGTRRGPVDEEEETEGNELPLRRGTGGFTPVDPLAITIGGPTLALGITMNPLCCPCPDECPPLGGDDEDEEEEN